MDLDISIRNATMVEVFEVLTRMASDPILSKGKVSMEQEEFVVKPPLAPIPIAQNVSITKTKKGMDKEPLNSDELAVIDPCNDSFEALKKFRKAFPHSKRSRQKVQLTWRSRHQQPIGKQVVSLGPPAVEWHADELLLISQQHGVHDAWEMYRLKFPTSERSKSEIADCYKGIKRGDITVPS